MEVYSWENHLSMGHLYHSYVSHNQRVTQQKRDQLIEPWHCGHPRGDGLMRRGSIRRRMERVRRWLVKSWRSIGIIGHQITGGSWDPQKRYEKSIQPNLPVSFRELVVYLCG